MLHKFYSKMLKDAKISVKTNPVKINTMMYENSPSKIPLRKSNDFQKRSLSAKKIIAKDLNSPMKSRVKSPKSGFIESFSPYVKNIADSSEENEKNLRFFKDKIKEIMDSLVNLYQILFHNLKGDEVIYKIIYFSIKYTRILMLN